MMNDDARPSWRTLEALLEQLRRANSGEASPEEDTPLGRMTKEFFRNNWLQACDGLLAKTDKIRVIPDPGPAPRCFHFEIDTPYKCKHGGGPVTLAPGPVRGEIRYHPQVLSLTDRDTPTIAVAIDADLGFYHPNHSRVVGQVCLGDLPKGPFPLDALLEHLFSILTYANWRSSSPADAEAAIYFETNPEALVGVGDPAPLY